MKPCDLVKWYIVTEPNESDFLPKLRLSSWSSTASIVVSRATRSFSDGVELDGEAGDDDATDGDREVIERDVDVDEGVIVVTLSSGDDDEVH